VFPRRTRWARRKEFTHGFGPDCKARDHLGDLRTDGNNFERQGVKREGHSDVSELGPVEGHL
jgi:hypothetical protein